MKSQLFLSSLFLFLIVTNNQVNGQDFTSSIDTNTANTKCTQPTSSDPYNYTADLTVTSLVVNAPATCEFGYSYDYSFDTQILLSGPKPSSWINAQLHWDVYDGLGNLIYSDNQTLTLNPEHIVRGNWTSSKNCVGTYVAFRITDEDWTGDCLNQPLPIILKSFDASVRYGTVNLEWQSYSEVNNDYYTLYKSSDGLNWEIFGKTDGEGTKTETTVYSMIDYEPYFGNNFYKLEQTDFDGTTEFLKIIRINVNSDKIISIYPNPTGKILSLNGVTPYKSKVYAMNMLGEKFMLSELERTTLGSTYDIAKLSSGSYQIMVLEEDELQFTQKVIINN